MAKAKTAYVCAECGSEHTKWQGQCADCGVWNSLSEIRLETAKPGAAAPRSGYAGAAVDAPKITSLDAVAMPRSVSAVSARR